MNSLPTPTTNRTSPGRSLLLLVVVLLILLPLAACTADGSFGLDPETPVFELEVSDERFRVAVTDPQEVVRFQARLQSGQEGVVSGTLLPGPGGVNGGWSWHLDPTTVHVADLAIEVCDGRPSMVEDDLTYWLQTVGRFCPWGAVVVARVR